MGRYSNWGPVFWGGDDAPQAPQYTAPPPQEEIMDVIDEITGTQSITVIGPDGKKRRKIERLPRTPEEQERFAFGEELIKKSINNINDLYQYNPENVINFEPLLRTFADLNDERVNALGQVANIGNIREDIQAFRDMQTALDDDMFMRQNRAMEENLGRQGLSNSYAGQEARAFAARNENLYRKQSEFNANQYGEDLASKRLGRNAQAFALDETGRAGRLASAQAEFQLRKDQQAEIENKRQTAIGENMNLLKVGSGITGQDLSKALATQAPQIANDTFSRQNADSLQRYTAGVNAQNAAYDRQRHAYDNRPPSFMDLALQGGGAIGGAMLTGSPESLGGRLGSRIF